MPGTKTDPDLSEFDLLAETSKSKRQPCPIARALDGLKPKDRRSLAAALGQGYAGPVIMRWLEAHGHEASGNAISNHRKGKCACNLP